MFRKKKELTMAEALTRQGVDVSVDPGATLLEELEDWWTGSEKNIRVYLGTDSQSSIIRLTGLGDYERRIATVSIDKVNIGGTVSDGWHIYVSAPPENKFSGRIRQCASKCDLTGKIVHV